LSAKSFVQLISLKLFEAYLNSDRLACYARQGASKTLEHKWVKWLHKYNEYQMEAAVSLLKRLSEQHTLAEENQVVGSIWYITGFEKNVIF